MDQVTLGTFGGVARCLAHGLIVSMAIGGCARRSAESPRPAATDTARTSPSNSEGRGHHGEADVCEELRQQFAVQLKDGGRCERDEDCLCFPRAIDCGGVSDQQTTQRLITLARMYQLSRCPTPNRCAEPICNPSCVAGRCVRAATAAIHQSDPRHHDWRVRRSSDPGVETER